MRPIRDPDVIARMETAFDLFDLAEEMMRQNLRRRFPAATEDEIEGRLLRWLQKRPFDEPTFEADRRVQQ